MISDFNNPQVRNLPKHLRQYIVDQNYSKYTPTDQAVWRYVMRQNYAYLKDAAYYPYIPGLKKAGLTIERIPDLQQMNDALGKIGWGAVTVDGFIPPVAFMEYQAYKVLVIAADIRQMEHIEYTPAPDIIHESAGHAPIIGEKRYADYLSYVGSIGAKAMFSYEDFEVYEAIRLLSILKEMPDADPADVQKAEKQLEEKQANVGKPSEMALLSRLHWWTVEYGLIGTIEDPKIYGAGLLSSIGESAWCMRAEVKKLPYTIDAVNYYYDITKPQPQLFVTPDFDNLIAVLEEFADTMAYRVGGAMGLQKAIDCKNVCTAIYSSGLQVTGVFSEFDGKNEQVNFIKTSSPSALSYDNKQLDGHGKTYHAHGFSSPVGRLKGINQSLESMSIADLKNIGIEVNSICTLSFEQGIEVKGLLKGITIKEDKNLIFSFEDCTAKDTTTGKILFEPSWGIYDMAIGERIVSVFCGSADKDAFDEVAMVSKTQTHQVHYDAKTLTLHTLYGEVRNIREKNLAHETLVSIWVNLQKDFPSDYLLALEILELVNHDAKHSTLANEIRTYLHNMAEHKSEYKKLILDGIHIIDNPIVDSRLEAIV